MSKILPTAQWVNKNLDFYDCCYNSIIIPLMGLFDSMFDSAFHEGRFDVTELGFLIEFGRKAQGYVKIWILSFGCLEG
jgi:hypothetical protein